MSKHVSKEQTENKELKSQIETLLQQRKNLANEMLRLKDVAVNNEIILNRTLRYLTGRLIQIKKNLSTEKVDELIEYLNRIEDDTTKSEPVKQENDSGK